MGMKRKPKTPDPSLLAAAMMNDLLSRIDPERPKIAPEKDTTGKDPAAVALGRKGGLVGGKARAAKLGKKKLSVIGRKMAAARWSRKDQGSSDG